jgi:hypothetical protein
MDPVSNVDRLVQLIRKRLEERSKATAARKDSSVGHVQPTGRPAIPAITGKLAQAGANDALMRRTVVEQLLADQLGPALVNDARFQQIVDQVTQAMTSDDVIGNLLGETVKTLQSDDRGDDIQRVR